MKEFFEQYPDAKLWKVGDRYFPFHKKAEAELLAAQQSLKCEEWTAQDEKASGAPAKKTNKPDATE